MTIEESSLSFSEACNLRIEKYLSKKSIVLTNGCFDLLHAGHVYSLQEASKLGDELWVALNSDESIRKIKGPSRPIYNQEHRAFMLKSLSCVSQVFFFDQPNLSMEIRKLKPDYYVKSGDYRFDTLNSEELDSLKEVKAKIFFVPFLEGISTTSTITGISKSIK